DEERWESRLDATALSADIDRPRYLSARALSDAIEYRERNGLNAGEFEEHYWGRLFIGIVFALGFWLLQTQFVKLASAFKFDFRVAYLLPTVIMVGVSIALFRRR